MSEGGALVRYDAMCRAIAEAYAVDEVKDIRDKALAFEAYAKQAKNTEAERRACEIRLRAERKAGQLLQEMDKNKGAAQPTRSSDTTTLRELGISKDQSSRWQRLAAVPEAEFEAALAAPDKPSTGGIIAKTKTDPGAETMRATPDDAPRKAGNGTARRSPWRHWRPLDEALDHLTGLPAPGDVNIPPSKRDGLTRRVALARRWLQDFEEEWKDAP
ncbi:MAG: hypothetical protein OEU09_14105 [Rhodospirillales bacterium]|nr:hypothetical protein [Rhodospirillales bacterium]MDH3912422.1 hypothetical protein [Rhodospirillales bacterium]